jgi:hypothetical protein
VPQPAVDVVASKPEVKPPETKLRKSPGNDNNTVNIISGLANFISNGLRDNNFI